MSTVTPVHPLNPNAILVSAAAQFWLEGIWCGAVGDLDLDILCDMLQDDNSHPRFTLWRLIAAYRKPCVQAADLALATRLIYGEHNRRTQTGAERYKRRWRIYKAAGCLPHAHPLDIVLGHKPPKLLRERGDRFVPGDLWEAEQWEDGEFRLTHRVVVGAKWVLNYSGNDNWFE